MPNAVIILSVHIINKISIISYIWITTPPPYIALLCPERLKDPITDLFGWSSLQTWAEEIGNVILQETYGQKFTRSLGREFCYPDGCQNSWSLHFANETGRVNQINMNDDMGTLVGPIFLAHRPLRNAFIRAHLFRSPEVMEPLA